MGCLVITTSLALAEVWALSPTKLLSSAYQCGSCSCRRDIAVPMALAILTLLGAYLPEVCVCVFNNHKCYGEKGGKKEVRELAEIGGGLEL